MENGSLPFCNSYFKFQEAKTKLRRNWKRIRRIIKKGNIKVRLTLRGCMLIFPVVMKLLCCILFPRRTETIWHGVRVMIKHADDVSTNKQAVIAKQWRGPLSLPGRALASRYLCPSVTTLSPVSARSLARSSPIWCTHAGVGRLL